jgi:hypothetical protein
MLIVSVSQGTREVHQIVDQSVTSTLNVQVLWHVSTKNVGIPVLMSVE